MARALGQALARTDEYQTLRRAIQAADGDREIQELTNRLQELEERVHGALERGMKPDAALEGEYEGVVGKLQASQANFDKIVQRVNLTIQKGLEEGGTSRIIIPG
jgi:cell fate (sporulation/competence/biofilm development) regulator YlbF (YheA/YmcA/DUF963 family)